MDEETEAHCVPAMGLLRSVCEMPVLINSPLCVIATAGPEGAEHDTGIQRPP